ncbi:hypothetical protein NP603_15190 [Methylomonas sp. SURF-1]|uniref:Uncharacterized protein n=1 Tax=Methylomonas aurea TaxID=2952224 RepID=A0ABT1ULC1_9GAMM|nr:hypothetical protein [Methylomonas sp. SURF-1]MCQ8182465.1 hypothetical protein [Methylomonas sp. SURF-1]
MLVILSILGVSLLLLGILIWAFIRHRRKARAGASAPIPKPTQTSLKTDQAVSPPAEPASPAVTSPSAEAVTPPAPDSTSQSVKVSAATATTASNEREPEDSILRRHYQAAKLAEKEVRTNPYPTDSVLRRHYDTAHKADSTAERNADNRPSRVASESAAPAIATVAAKSGIPQDSVLRRHFLAHLAHQIESELPGKPSDSVLKRHYETIVAHKLQQYLTRMHSA